MRYDDTDLPTGYDLARTRPPEILADWTATVAQHLPAGLSVRTILDLGCGTGRFSQPLRDEFGAVVIGVDPSSRMLRQARAKSGSPHPHFALGSGEALPLRDASVELIFMSMVFHHFDDVPEVLRECRRVLKPEGCVFLRTGMTDRILEYPTSEYFPTSIAIMEQRLWSVDGTRGAFHAAGLRTLHAGVVNQEIAPNHTVYAEQLAAGGDSVLAQLETADFDAGLARIRSVAATARSGPVEEPIDFLVFG